MRPPIDDRSVSSIPIGAQVPNLTPQPASLLPPPAAMLPPPALSPPPNRGMGHRKNYEPECGEPPKQQNGFDIESNRLSASSKADRFPPYSGAHPVGRPRP